MDQNERMQILARGLGLFLAVVLPLAVMPGNGSRLAGTGEAYAQTGVPFGIYMPPAHKVCEYNSVFVLRRDLLSDGLFDSTLLDIAQACGTKVVVRLHGLTRDITGDSGGLDLAKFEDQVNDFAGLIDPYVEDGTIIAHLAVDEPHHCFDWLDVCPTPSEVDQAAQISKSYWPSLPTVVNTLPVYASAYDWVHTDVMNFQYAYHRGPLDIFIFRVLGTLNNGHVGELSWSMQALEGGCTIFGDCPMTPAQVEEVGTAMCDTGTGFTLGFFKYDEDLVDEAMQQSINYLRVYCGDTVGYPPYAVPGPDQTVDDADCNGFESVTLDGSASYDQDGSIVGYEWKEGETVLGNAAVLTHDFAVGYHPLILTVTDNDGLISANDVTVIVQESIKTVEFFHSFEADEWSGLWEEDAQDDWQRTDRRAAGGVYSAEVDGFARDATLSMVSAVDLSGKSRARLSYSWGIRSGWRKGEYIALDFYDGVEWQEVKRLRADVDPEDVWLNESIELADYLVADFKVRFRATVRFPTRDGYVDSVKIVSCAVPAHQSPAADAGSGQTATDEDRDGVDIVSLMGSGPTGPRPLSSALP